MTSKTSPQLRRLSKVSEIILENKQMIVSSWSRDLVDACKRNDIDLGESEIESVTGECLDEFIQALKGKYPEEDISPSFFGLFWCMNSQPSLLVEALWLLKRTLSAIIDEKLPGRRGKAPAEWEKMLNSLASKVLDRHVMDMQESIDQANGRVILYNYIANMAANSLDLTEVLTQAGGAIAAAAGANHSFFYLIGDEDSVVIFTPTTSPLNEVFNVPGSAFHKITHDYLSPSDALWQVLKEKKPVAIPDAQTSANISQQAYLPKTRIKSFLLIPCMAKSRVVAVAVIMTFEVIKEFSPEEIEAALAIAAAVAPAIENAQLHQKVEQLAALEERARMARAIHDSLAQTLGVMQLKASQTGELLNSDQLEAARKNVSDLSAITREAFTDMREAIFNLRARAPGGVDFLTYLKEYLSTYQTCFGIKTSLDAEPDTTLGVSDENTDQIMYIIQEALANTRKHAAASSITVTLERSKAILQVNILDDGVGFDPKLIQDGNTWDHFGLQIIKERADAIGGIINIDSLPGIGTRVMLTLPLEVNFEPTLEGREI